MQSFLVIGSDPIEIKNYTSEFLKENEISQFDVNLNIFEKAMGIEDVRNIQKSVFLKPFHGETKAVIVQAPEGITLEAQNALLKILEEPPANTIIAIFVIKKEVVLSTIISRCKIIFLQEKETKLAKEETTKFDSELDSLLKSAIGNKLKTAEILSKDKTNLDLWFEKMATLIKNKLRDGNENSKYFNILKELQKTFKIIKSTNTNPRAALENLFMSF